MEQAESTFEDALTRLEEIVTEVRKKDTDLDRSLELLEEGVTLANVCTEKIDHTRIFAGDQETGEREVQSGEGQLP